MEGLFFETKVIQLNNVPRKILLQNENGPCSLIALANILLIAPNYQQTSQQLIEYVNRTERVSLETLVQILANMGIQTPNGANIDINQLLQVLPKLHTGLNVNPKFNGTFEDGVEMSIFRLYNIGIVHGWMIDPNIDPIAYQRVSNYSYEEAQNILVKAYDITTTNLEVPNKEEIVNDSSYVKSFLARSATQLTNYGITYMKSIMMENSYVVFFRNDHFSTLHKNNGELYTLVTDLGFKNQPNIVWQSLKSVNGSQDLFYTGNFVSAIVQEDNIQQGNENTVYINSSQQLNTNNPFADSAPGVTPDYDAVVVNANQPVTRENVMAETDEELARRLQQEEDEQFAGNMQRAYNRESTANRTNQSKEAKSEKKDKKKKNKFSLKEKKSCIIM